MNISDANDVNVVLRYLLGLRSEYELEVDDQDLYDNAREAAKRLVTRARKALSAGLDAGDIEDAWERLDLQPWWDEPVPYRPIADVPDPRGLLSDPAGPTDCAHRATPHDHRAVMGVPYVRLPDGRHRHEYLHQALEHRHADGDRPHGYFEHPEDGVPNQKGAQP